MFQEAGPSCVWVAERFKPDDDRKTPYGSSSIHRVAITVWIWLPPAPRRGLRPSSILASVLTGPRSNTCYMIFLIHPTTHHRRKATPSFLLPLMSAVRSCAPMPLQLDPSMDRMTSPSHISPLHSRNQVIKWQGGAWHPPCRGTRRSSRICLQIGRGNLDRAKPWGLSLDTRQAPSVLWKRARGRQGQTKSKARRGKTQSTEGTMVEKARENRILCPKRRNLHV
jgi:hypothetical protein